MTATRTVLPTLDPSVDGLLSGVRWSPHVITFGFPSSGSEYTGGYGAANTEPADGFVPFSSAEQHSVRKVLALYSDVAALTFQETAGGAAELRYGRTQDVDGTSPFAWAYYPNRDPIGGDVWFAASWSAAAETGSFDFLALLHETGHALGLKHPFERAYPFPALPSELDGNDFTVMSYQCYPDAGFNVTAYGDYARTPMALDVAAVQAMYGANYATRSGSTVYSWDQHTGEAFIDGVAQGRAGHAILDTVWDGGGRDRYDFSSWTVGLSIDLNPGHWVAAIDPASSPTVRFDADHRAPGMVCNAFLYHENGRSLIEDATGGSAADILIGNDAANRLYGGEGDDTLIGGAGPDTLDGGVGFDTADYSHAGSVVLDFSAFRQDGAGGDVLRSIERIVCGDYADVVIGAGFAVTVEAGGGDDILLGSSKGDKLYGGDGDDVLGGRGGADTLVGGAGNDTAAYSWGTTGVDVNLSRAVQKGGDAQGDLLIGIENVRGTDYADRLAGDSGANKLDGAGGNDTLFGGGGDTLVGGAGNDTFVFDRLLNGVVDVADFESGDKIKFAKQIFADADQVMHAMMQVGDDVVIVAKWYGQVRVEHAHLSDFHASDFAFG